MSTEALLRSEVRALTASQGQLGEDLYAARRENEQLAAENNTLKRRIETIVTESMESTNRLLSTISAKSDMILRAVKPERGARDESVTVIPTQTKFQVLQAEVAELRRRIEALERNGS